MQYVYSTVYTAVGGGGRESIYNDYRLFQNRLLSKKCMKFSILSRFGDHFFFQIVRNFLTQKVATCGRLGPIVKLATFGDFPDLFWRLAAPNTWQPWACLAYGSWHHGSQTELMAQWLYVVQRYCTTLYLLCFENLCN